MQTNVPKRTRSSGLERDEKKGVVEGQTVPEGQVEETVDKEKEKEDYRKMMKSLKKQVKEFENSKMQEQVKDQHNQKRQKKSKSKHKEKEKEAEGDGKDESKHKKKKKKKEKEIPDGQVKDQVQPEKSKEKTDDKNKQGQQVKEEEKPKQKKKKKKKSQTKPKQKDSDDQGEMKEQDSLSQQVKPKKKSKKKQAGSDDEEEQDAEKVPKKKKIKKQQQKKKRGRKPAGPVKRKKESIFQRQQIINKKYRVKKKSHYLNRQSQRAWGPMRAGPYRETRKTPKQQQRRIIQALWGDGPNDRKEKNENKTENEKEGQQEKMDEEKDVKIEEENNQNVNDKPIKKKDQTDSEKEEAEKPKPKKRKSKKKKQADQEKDRTVASSSKKKKKAKKDTDDTEVKMEGGESTKATSKKSKAKTVQDGSNADENQAKVQHDSDNEGGKKKKKKKKQQSQDQDEDNSQQNSDEEEGQDGKSKKTKKDGTKKQSSKKKVRTKPTKQEQQQFTKQQSEKIINLFAVDGGNYPEMMKELPGIRLKRVRMHLRMLFHRSLDLITYQVQHRCSRKIKQWQQDQKVQIVRQLHRIRSSNRLLSQSNVAFRNKMTALMHSYNDEQILNTVTEEDFQSLYRRLQSFVRGYNTINKSKRASAASITENKNKQKEQRYKFSKEVTRKPIICGGHLLSRGMKSQENVDQRSQFQDSSKIPPEKIVDEWNREEEKTLCQLYVANETQPDETICQKLNEIYGPSIKWRDFDTLGRKINQLVNFALIKLQNLTARPYSREERKQHLEKIRARLLVKLQKKSDGTVDYAKFYKEKLKATSMFTYDKELFQKQERLEYKHRIFKNLSKFQRQIFGHAQSQRFKSFLVKILIQEFPSQEDVENAIRQAKKFAKWARNDERKNVTSVKNVFVGDREDYSCEDGENDNEDSVMADIDKVEIIKRNIEGKELSRAESGFLSDDQEKDCKSNMRGSTKAGTQADKQPIQIVVDDEVEVSDFQEPESAQIKESRMDEQSNKEYNVLEKLYSHLSKSQKK